MCIYIYLIICYSSCQRELAMKGDYATQAICTSK